MQNCDEKQRARMIGELYMPLPGDDVDPDDVQVGPWSDEAMSSAFLATRGAMTGRT